MMLHVHLMSFFFNKTLIPNLVSLLFSISNCFYIFIVHNILQNSILVFWKYEPEHFSHRALSVHFIVTRRGTGEGGGGRLLEAYCKSYYCLRTFLKVT